MLQKYLVHLKHLPVQLVLCLVLALSFGHFLNYATIQVLFTASCVIKDILITALPVVIFAYIFDALLGLDKKAPLLLITILVMVFLSNVIGVLVSGGVAHTFLPLLSPFKTTADLAQNVTVNPLFELHLPQLIAPDMAMFAGIGLGLMASFLKIDIAKKYAQFLHMSVTWFLQKTFIPVLPIYVIGFVLKLQYEGALSTIIHSYFQVFVLAISLIFIYLNILYFIGSGFKIGKYFDSLKNMLPAGVTGFSTMSSAATLPVTLEAAEKNLKDPRFADLIIPTTVNIHLLGDVLAIPLTGLALLWFKTGVFPGFEEYFLFAVMFGVAKFSCAGVPGGGVLVILPVLHKYLGLDQEMITLMTTIYILQDSIFTASNIMGNGAFSMIVERICRFFFGNGDDNDQERKIHRTEKDFSESDLEPCVRRTKAS